MLLAACGQLSVAPTAEPPVVTEAPTEAPAEAPTAEPTPEPTPERTTRVGGWLDEIVYTVADPAAVLTQIQAGDVDIYAEGLGPAQLEAIKESGLGYSSSQGTYYDIFQPSTFKDGVSMPQTARSVKRSTGWLIVNTSPRKSLTAAQTKWFAITEWPECDLADTVRILERYYAYDPDKAKEVITAEMEGMGAELVVGLWSYNGEPIKLNFLIRNDAARTAMGDWIADKLEEMGFAEIDRQYKSGSEASPIWIGSDPKEGQWHLHRWLGCLCH